MPDQDQREMSAIEVAGRRAMRKLYGRRACDGATYAAASERASPEWHAGYRAGLAAGRACAAAAQPGPVATQMQMLDHLESLKTDPATLATLRAAATGQRSAD